MTKPLSPLVTLHLKRRMSVLFQFLKRNKKTVQNLCLLLFFGAGLFSTVFAAADPNCDPESAPFGLNLHCQFFDNEVYKILVFNGAIITKK